MGEAKSRRVKEVTVLEEPLAAMAVVRVSHYRVTHPGQVHPDLMRPPRVRLSLDK